ncbi:hypothetical protein HNQ07_004570 [Deinococcus metalli]|uniref:Uncharacterized protein n=1 Tax=Deinococcus metalli TaxID=1141878 RepID=A0A7W8KJ08_9DEIO|nr:hypothetical protein [Deinococcus metalli]
MELLLAGLAIVISLVLAAWQDHPAAQRSPARPPRRR